MRSMETVCVGDVDDVGEAVVVDDDDEEKGKENYDYDDDDDDDDDDNDADDDDVEKMVQKMNIPVGDVKDVGDADDVC